MLNNINAVFFDLDGTLIDSMWVWKDIDIDFLGKRNIELPDDLQDSIEGMSFTETAQYFKERFNFKESVEEIKEIWNKMAYDCYVNRIKLKKGVVDFLNILKEMGIKVGITTSNSTTLVEGVLKSQNIEDKFDLVLTACEVNAGKPAPDIYLEAAQRLNVMPDECLVFEDVPMGILAGKNAHMKVCAVYDDFSKNQDNKKRTLADFYINDFNDVINKTYEVLTDE